MTGKRPVRRKPLQTAGGCPMSMLTGTSAGRQARWRQHLVMENGVDGGLSWVAFSQLLVARDDCHLGSMSSSMSTRIWCSLHMSTKDLGETRADGGY